MNERMCPSCHQKLAEGYKIKVNTYGALKLEPGRTKPGEIAAGVCPVCGQIALYLQK